MHSYYPKGEPERRWLWKLELAGGVLAGSDNLILSLHAQSVSIAGHIITPIEVPELNQIMKYAGKPAGLEMTLMLQQGYDQDSGGTSKNALGALERWMTKVFNPATGEMGFASQYKLNGKLIILKPDLTEARHYDVEGVWPSSPGDLNYDWAAAEHVTRSVTFSVDKLLPPDVQTGS